MSKRRRNRKDVVVCRVEKVQGPLSESLSQHGIGPYRNAEGGVVNVDPDRHPSPFLPREPWYDPDDAIYDEIFGFGSIGQLCRWFNDRERASLACQGYALAFYQVPAGAMRNGKSQVTFDKHKAEKIGALPLSATIERPPWGLSRGEVTVLLGAA